MNFGINQSSATRGLKGLLCGSVAVLCLAALAAPALAQSGEPDPAPGGFLNWGAVERAPQIVIAGPGTPTTARDPQNVTGVGQMIVDQQNGFIGLCTVTLINPRTVIFAAHCVNGRAANAYGPGGTPIGFGFGNNNNATGASAFGGWLGTQPGHHQTNTSRFMYNSNYVAYHPASLEPAARSFLYGDVAVASLDTVARDVPSWSMLFSALPARPVTAAGTGYHVNLSGYGNNGTGVTGSTGSIDYRRRLAENMLGGLASIDDFEGFLFGAPAGGLPQNLYWIDFDDPRRGTAQASPFDFNAWRDNALPREGITASGDSGGPLILDSTFAKPVIAGVLSGGYTRFFNGQPANGYGTASFYQPLYLYWDWIAANNPYHYVSALAGDANWTDATHWVTNLDPNYQIIGPNGQLVNGVPGDVGAGPRGPDTNGFGQMCFQSGGFSDCRDVATGANTSGPRPIGTGASSGDAVVSVQAVLENGADEDSAEASIGFSGTETVTAVLEAQAGAAGDIGPSALPAATLLNGLPGASNFVPVNFDGNRLTSTPPRYFDVTLSANGTTTLNTAVTIDRLTMAGVGAGLNITSTGNLLSNIDITQLTGTLNIDGALRTPGDFFIMTGGLSGSGAITAPFFTNMAGVISPGTTTTTGTLTFNGNVILASGGALLINLGANGISDRLAVNGAANVGGLVSFGMMPGAPVAYGNSYTFLTATGGVTGTFSNAPISAILRPTITYTSTAVRVQIDAASYASVVAGTPVQTAYAQLLDQNRAAYAQFSSIYGPLDVQSAASIQATLESWAPRAETLRTSMGVAAMDSMASFYRDRLTGTGAEMDGSLQVLGRPIDYASVALDSLDGGVSSPIGDPGDAVVIPDVLPENMRGFIAAGYLDGKGEPMTTALPGGGKDEFDGYFIAGGVETALNRQTMLGFGVSTTDLSGTTANAPQAAEGDLFLGTVYINHRADNGWLANGMFTMGEFDTETTRIATVGLNTFTLTTDDSARAMGGEVGFGFRSANDQVSVTPGASLRASKITYGPTTESGGGPALTYQRESTTAIESRIGVTVSGLSPTFRPYGSAAWVHGWADTASSFGANFVGGVGPDAIFALGSDDRDWAEVGVGLEAIQADWRFTVAAETTLGRDDVETRSYRAAVSVKF